MLEASTDCSQCGKNVCIYTYIMIYDTYVNYIRISFNAVMKIFWFLVDVSQSLDMFFTFFRSFSDLPCSTLFE